jgi:UDP-N-acetylglucosamine 2-epimerase (non-hydrolysing)/GDP/UDP-N,N'-diacetylbacillosamine 2-epimerase (hydrolysing)
MNIGKRIVVSVTGTRADYGLMMPVHRAIAEDPELKLHLIITGMHLLPEFRCDLDTIRHDGFGVMHEVSMLLGEDSQNAMAQGIGLALLGISNILRNIGPDILLLQGDRGEMLAGAIAAGHMNIPVVHMSGGDFSGSIDDSVRNAISKFAHIHLTSCASSTQRLIDMGEVAERIIETGDPAVDQINTTTVMSRTELGKRVVGLGSREPFLVATLHPVTDEADESAAQMMIFLDALEEIAMTTVVTYPNSDAGGRAMRQVLEGRRGKRSLCIEPSMGSHVYLSLLRHASAMVGNSSSGIVESASFKIPAINVGSRQIGRLRGNNVIDVGFEKKAIRDAVYFALHDVAFKDRLASCRNPYGDGHASKRTTDVLKRLKLGPALTAKWRPSAGPFLDNAAG